MRTQQQRSQHRVRPASILITFLVVILFSCSQNTVAQQWNTNGNDISNANTGNVGIGTSSPAQKLEISGVSPLIQMSDTSSTGIKMTLGTTGSWSGFSPNRNLVTGSHFDTGRTTAGYFIWVGNGDSLHWWGTTPTNNAEPIERMRLDRNGNLGIGTPIPTTKLHVQGDGKFTGNVTVNGNIAARYQDVAEWVPATDTLLPGTVVAIDPTKSNHVEASSEAYNTRVAGVISAQPGIALGEQTENKVLVATTGRVRIKVIASDPIQVGDLLVTSDVPGVAMKSQPVNIGGVRMHRPGTLIGKALEPLAKGSGEILVLLSLQ